MSDAHQKDWVGATSNLPPKPAVTKEQDDEAETVCQGDAWRMLRGQRQALQLAFVFRDGCDFSMPYALLPSIWTGPGNSFLIEYPQFTVKLCGRNLEELKQAVRRHLVTLVRELDGLQAAALPIAVTSIEIVDWFPSREVVTIGRVTGLWPMAAGSREGDARRAENREHAEA